MSRVFIVNGKEYELYQAASGDYCVSVSEYGKERLDYNLSSREAALDFILIDSGSEADEEEGE